MPNIQGRQVAKVRFRGNEEGVDGTALEGAQFLEVPVSGFAMATVEVDANVR